VFKDNGQQKIDRVGEKPDGMSNFDAMLMQELSKNK